MGQSIAIFDYRVTPTNPIGGCHLRMLRGLCREHDFTVFAVEFENPCPDRIRFVRVPAPRRPQALLFVCYHLMAPLCYLAHRLRYRRRFDHVQHVECNLAFGDVAYSQFCHRFYLKHHWPESPGRGLGGWFRWLDHRLRALIEPWTYRRVDRVVVPSLGLVRELEDEFGYPKPKIPVLPNPVDVGRMSRPADFDRPARREALGIGEGDVALVFVALGQFDRKGLPLLLGAVARLRDPRLKLIVVGPGAERVLERLDDEGRAWVKSQSVFVGMQRDVRPFLWCADAFAFPSFYEVFPLVSLEAAAAGLPLIVAPMNGVEEFVRDGENGIVVQRTVDNVACGITRFLELTQEHRQQMGRRAQQDVRRYDLPDFVASWRDFYASLCPGRRAEVVA